jgi:hypothetical protein
MPLLPIPSVRPVGWTEHGVTRCQRSRNFSQFVEGENGWTRARVDLEKARLFARDEREDGAEISHVSAKFYALQNVIN